MDAKEKETLYELQQIKEAKKTQINRCLTCVENPKAILRNIENLRQTAAKLTHQANAAQAELDYAEEKLPDLYDELEDINRRIRKIKSADKRDHMKKLIEKVNSIKDDLANDEQFQAFLERLQK